MSVIEVQQRRRDSSECEIKRLNVTQSGDEVDVNHNLTLDSEVNLLLKLRTRRERRERTWIVAALAFGNFCVAAGVSIQGPFFPKEAGSKGATPIVYSSIFSVYELVMLLTSFKFGQLVTKIPANLMCGLGLAIAGISTVTFGLLDHCPNGLMFIIPAFALRIVESLGATAFATSSYSMITFRFADKTATMFSIMETCFGLGLIVGPVLGGALYELGGYVLPFLTLGVLLTTSASHILIYIPNRTKDPEYNNNIEINGNKSETISVLKFVSNLVIILDSVVILTALSLIGFNSTTLEPHLRHLQLSPLITGLIFMTSGITYSLTTLLLGRLCDIYIHDITIFSISGTFICLVGLVLIGPMPGLGLATNLWLIILSQILFGIGTAAKQVSAYSHAVNYCVRNRGLGKKPSTYGLVSGMFFTCISMGGFIGPTIGGFFIEKFDYNLATIFMFSIDMLLIVLLLFCFISKKTKIL